MKWFYNMKIASKLISAFILVALLAGVVGIIGISNINTIEGNGVVMYTNMTIPIETIGNISEEFERIRVDTRDLITAEASDEINKYNSSISTRRDTITQNLDEFEKKIISDDVQQTYNDLIKAREEYGQYLDQVVTYAKVNEDSEALNILQSNAMVTVITSEQTAINKINELLVASAKSGADENTAAANTSTTLMIVVIAVGMLLALVVGLTISNLISKPIKKLVVVAEKIAGGDLDVIIDEGSKDETGILAKSFSEMSDKLNVLMTDINSAAEQVASGSKQVSDSSIALSQGATEQASSIEELTASIEEISSQTKLNAENANQANELAVNAKAKAVQGDNQMLAMSRAMEEINVSSNNISKIIKVIDDIAFQTNILALNAAVEAARAGQYGRGFAVVAEEVRSLAARSANAAKETNEMIGGSINKVVAGTKLANETAIALKEIVDEVEKVANLVENIATASNEQSLGIEQINQGVMQVSQVVQTNSATSEEGAAASEELSGQAELLKTQVSTFKLKKSGSGANNYNLLKDIDPDILKMIRNSNGKSQAVYHNDTLTASQSSGKKQIVLSDSELGKY